LDQKDISIGWKVTGFNFPPIIPLNQLQAKAGMEAGVMAAEAGMEAEDTVVEATAMEIPTPNKAART